MIDCHCDEEKLDKAPSLCYTIGKKVRDWMVDRLGGITEDEHYTALSHQLEERIKLQTKINALNKCAYMLAGIVNKKRGPNANLSVEERENQGSGRSDLLN